MTSTYAMRCNATEGRRARRVGGAGPVGSRRPRRRGGTVERVIAEDDVPGIDAAQRHGVARRARRRRRRAVPFDVIAGGHSNLTYRVTAADGRQLVLRRPPLGHVLASAHDMGREHRIIAGLQDPACRSPPALGFCDDVAVNGAPFYVMGFVDGYVVRDRATAERTPDAGRRGPRQPLARRHDGGDPRRRPRAAGLADLGRHEGYIARQLKRWYGQWNQQKTRELPLVDEVHDALAGTDPRAGPGDDRPRRLPPRQHASCPPDGDVAAVLDWEICTLGDPLADVGLLQVYWTGPDDEPERVGRPVDDGAGLLGPGPDCRALRRGVGPRRLAASTSTSPSATGSWPASSKGVYARYLGGALGDRDPAELAPFAAQVDGSAPRWPPRRLERHDVMPSDHRFVREPPDARRAGARRDADAAGSTPAAPPRRR